MTVIRSQSHLSQKQQFFGACGAEPVCCSRGGHCCGAPRKPRAAPTAFPTASCRRGAPSGGMWARLAPSVIRALGLRDASGRLSEPQGPELLTGSAPRSLARSARFRKQITPPCALLPGATVTPRGPGRRGAGTASGSWVPRLSPHGHAPRCLRGALHGGVR